MMVGSAVQKYGPDLDATTVINGFRYAYRNYMAESTILELKIAKKEGEDKIQEQIAMAKLYLYQAVDVVTLKRKRKHYPLLKETNNA
jgi:negative regulator of sigma E activity